MKINKFLFWIFVFGPLTVAAQGEQPKEGGAVGELLGVICKLANYMFTLAIVLSVIMTLYAAFKYMIASGDASKVEEAHKTLIYVAVGVAVAIMAGGLPYIIADLVNETIKTGCS